MVCSPLEKIFFFSFMVHWGTCVDSTPEGASLTPWGKFFSSQPLWDLPLCLRPSRESSMILGKNFTFITY